MKLGSWRDPEVARDARIGIVLSAVVLLIVAAPSGLGWVFLGPLMLGAIMAMLMGLRGGPRNALGGARADFPHPGYNISRVAVAGFPGLVLVGGFVLMFWSGLPGMRPVVVLVALLGCVAGLGLIVLGRSHRTPESNVLGLAPRAGSGSDAKGERGENG